MDRITRLMLGSEQLSCLKYINIVNDNTEKEILKKNQKDDKNII